jgi:hypothetical protein
MKTMNIHESVSKLLTLRLEKYKNKSLNKETCIQIYSDIFDCFVDLFQESNIKIANESMNLLAQMYYESITINSNQELDPSIFEQRASVKNIETKELALLATMLSGTAFSGPFITEIKRRS